MSADWIYLCIFFLIFNKTEIRKKITYIFSISKYSLDFIHMLKFSKGVQSESDVTKGACDVTHGFPVQAFPCLFYSSFQISFLLKQKEDFFMFFLLFCVVVVG